VSTRIYKGFVVEGTTDLRVLMDKVAAFRPWVTAEAERVERTFVGFVDAEAPGTGQRLWWDRRAEVRRTGHRDPAVDTSFDLCFIPVEGKTLGIAFVERGAWFQEWLKQPGVAEYGYWNSSEQPDEISDAEWERRARDWEVIKPIPVSEQGFTIQLTSDL